MKKLLLIMLVAYGLYSARPVFLQWFNPNEPLYAEPYIVVYGRDTCGYTQNTRRNLKASGIPYEYVNVDDLLQADILHERMRNSGIDTRRYDLPVVDVDNHLSVRPKFKAIIEEYGD